MMEKVVADAEELPKAIVRRVVKEKLSHLSTNSDISVLRDSLLAFSESARIFIHYLSAAAIDICKDSNRQIMNAEDVFKALEEIEFHEFIGPLRACLEGDVRMGEFECCEIQIQIKILSARLNNTTDKEFRQRNAEKKSESSKAKKATSKNVKRKETPTKSEGRSKRQAVKSEDNSD